MSEVVNVVVAVAVIVFLVKWATSGQEDPEARKVRTALGFKPKDVTPEMVDLVHNMFPNIPKDNIKYDLLKTGNAEVTTNKILEKGFLDAPPAGYYRIYPRTAEQLNATQQGAAVPAASSSSTQRNTTNLISRFNLESRLATADPTLPPDDTDNVQAKGTWEPTAEEREASLKERKAQMIIAARQRMLAAQQKPASPSPSASSSS